MPELKSFEDQVRDLYRFFVNAEQNNEEVTYDQIRERLVDRKYETLVWYANNFWSWFLSKKKERRGRYRVFVCRGLVRYPEDFFVAAHVNSQGKYFYHFGGALDASRERARLRKQTKEQPDPSESPIEAGQVEAGQEFPEALHIADNETEGDESPTLIAHTFMAATPREPAPFIATTPIAEEPSSEIPLSDLSAGDSSPVEDTSTNAMLISPSAMARQERITGMLDFSRKNREALEQLRQTVERLAQEQGQFRTEVTRDLQAVQQTQHTHTQQITALSQLSTDLAGQLQAVQRALVEEFVRRIAALIEEVHRSQTPPDFSSLHTDLTNQLGHTEQVLTEALQQLPAPPDLSAIHQELESSTDGLKQALMTELQQPHAIPELSQAVDSIAHIDRLIREFAQHTSVSSNSYTERIDTSMIRNASAEARHAIDTLESTCEVWIGALRQLFETIQATRQARQQAEQRSNDEENKSFQALSAFVSSDGSPDELKPSDGAEASE